MFRKHGLICLVLLFSFLKTSIAVESNRTIDDTLGDLVTGERPKYLPPSGIWENSACRNCLLLPDGILAFNGTWAAATYEPSLKSMSIELAFKGTAIYIFFILADIVEQNLPTETACNFTLDGQPAGSFTHIPSPNNTFLYDSLVFSQRDLPNVDHRFVISTSDLDRRVWVNFDYAIYTFDDAPSPPRPTSLSSSSSSLSPQSSTLSTPSPTVSMSQPSIPSPATDAETPAHTGAMAGGIIGGFVSFFAILLLFLFWRRRRKAVKRNDGELPAALPHISSRYQYNDSNARFITPFVTPHWDPSGSQPGRNGALPPAVAQEAQVATTGPLTTTDNPYPPSPAQVNVGKRLEHDTRWFP